MYYGTGRVAQLQGGKLNYTENSKTTRQGMLHRESRTTSGQVILLQETNTTRGHMHIVIHHRERSTATGQVMSLQRE